VLALFKAEVLLHAWRFILGVVINIDFKHGADKSVADRPDVAPRRVKSRLNVRPQAKDEFHAHAQVGRLRNVDLNKMVILNKLTSGVDSLMLSISTSIVISSI